MATDTNQPFDDESAVRTFVQSISDQLADNLDRLVGFKPPDAGYFPPNSDWLTWAKKGKLVRLDVAIYAVHLASARMLYKPIPHIVGQKLQKTAEKIAEIGVEVASFKLLSGAVGFLFRILVDLVALWREETEQREIEQSLRINMAKTMREMGLKLLPQKGGRRARKLVSSRHNTPPQRRANR